VAKSKIDPRNQLTKALDFLSITFSAKALEQGMHCILDQHSAKSFNFVIAAGTTIEEDLSACPRLDLMAEAAAQCGPEYEIVQLSDTKLLVRSGEFQAYVPCLRPGVLSQPIPDPPAVEINDDLLVALSKVAPLLKATAETVLEQSIQLNSGSCLSTDRKTILETWHGFDLPDGLLLPKVIVTALKAAKKPLARFGASKDTATFYFSDGSWLRSQLFVDKWPATITRMLDCHPTLRNVPPDLFSSARKVAPFSADGAVYVHGDNISSHPFPLNETGSALHQPIGSYHEERVYLIECLNVAARHAVLWDERAKPDGTYFEGKGIRGLIYHRQTEDVGDDIPF
jgi:hypothetical protein